MVLNSNNCLNRPFFLYLITFLKSISSQNVCNVFESDLTCHDSKRSSMNIDESLNSLHQDDPKLIEIIKKQYLHPPSRKEYNFSSSNPDVNGQFGQALYIADTFFGNYSKKGNVSGFFVEAGAYDGELISNTLLFELRMGWSGILIEPNPFAFKKLLSKQRKAWSINCCLSMKPYPETVLFDVTGLVGGIVQNGIRPSMYQKPTHENRRQETIFWKKRNTSIHDIYRDLDGGESAMKEKLIMQCLPLYAILKAVGSKAIDILSLDVEGAEYGILLSLFEKKTDVRFRIGSIETSYSGLFGYNKSLIELSYLMKRNGYMLHKKHEEDHIYENSYF